jgi:hypothetical protein
MDVKINGRMIRATVQPVRNGFFLQCASVDAFYLADGATVELDGKRFEVRYSIRFPSGEPEVWAMVMPWERKALPF